MKGLVKSIAKKFPIDFIMYIGDENGNEPVFTYLNNIKQQSYNKVLAGVSFFNFTLISIFYRTAVYILALLVVEQPKRNTSLMIKKQ